MKQLTLQVLLVLSAVLIIQVASRSLHEEGNNRQKRSTEDELENIPIDQMLYHALEEAEADLTSIYPRVKMDFGDGPSLIDKGIFMDGDLVALEDGTRLLELDIALTADDLLKMDGLDARQRRAAVADTNRYWTNGTVPYYITDCFSNSRKTTIVNAMRDLEDDICVRFVERTTEVNYLYIQASSSGCWSYIGMTGGKQSLNLQLSGCVNKRIVQHEILHALGIWHEQSRPDRDEFVIIHWDNIRSGYVHNFHIKSGVDSRYIPYDYRSVMHYGRNSFSNGGGYTITPTDESMLYVIGNAPCKSHRDSWVLNLMYECATATPGCTANCTENESYITQYCTCACPDTLGKHSIDCDVFTCPDDQFKCWTGEKCIDGSARCDNVTDCSDGSDEYLCGFTCADDEFKCRTVDECIKGNARCDNITDCSDGSDEYFCGAILTSLTRSTTASPTTTPASTTTTVTTTTSGPTITGAPTPTTATTTTTTTPASTTTTATTTTSGPTITGAPTPTTATTTTTTTPPTTTTSKTTTTTTTSTPPSTTTTSPPLTRPTTTAGNKFATAPPPTPSTTAAPITRRSFFSVG